MKIQIVNTTFNIYIYYYIVFKKYMKYMKKSVIIKSKKYWTW